MVNFDLLNSLVPTNWKSDKNLFIHEFLIIKGNSWSKIFIIMITFRYFFFIDDFLLIYKSGLSKKFHWSFKWPLPIYFLVYIKLLLNAKYIPHRSHYTLIRILPCVCCKMNFKCTTMWESLLTLGASKWFLASVSNLMHHKSILYGKDISYC